MRNWQLAASIAACALITGAAVAIGVFVPWVLFASWIPAAVFGAVILKAQPQQGRSTAAAAAAMLVFSAATAWVAYAKATELKVDIANHHAGHA